LRRFLRGLASAPRDFGRSVATGWDGFVFTPADPTPLGLIRVVVGALLAWSLFVYGLDLRGYLGSTGWANLEVVRLFRAERTPLAWSFWFSVPDALLWPTWAACLAVLVAFTLGFWSRTTAILAWIVAVSTANRSPISIYGFDDIVTTWAMYLAATGACGQAVSLDRYLARLERNRAEVAGRRKDGRWTAPSGVPIPTVSANIALRLIQCHLVLIYGMSGLAKFQGQAWWGGTAIWGTLAAGEFRLFDLTWLAAYPWLLNAMTHAALFVETTYPALIWPRPTRPVVLASVAAMHLGIGLTLGLFEFSLAMLAGNIAFASGPWLRSLVSGVDQPGGRVLYDGACPRCRASMAFLTAGDPDHVIEPIDLTAVDVATVHHGLSREECLKAMHLVRRDGRVEVGYDAVMTLLAWTPAASPLALARHLPGVSWIGRRAYDRIAASRPRDVACADEVCGIHPPPSGEKKARAAGSAPR